MQDIYNVLRRLNMLLLLEEFDTEANDMMLAYYVSAMIYILTFLHDMVDNRIMHKLI